MRKAAILIKPPENAPDATLLMELCRKGNFDVQERPGIPSADEFLELLLMYPLLIFLPFIEEDCMSVKLTQEALLSRPPCVILLYANSLPSSKHLSLAFREGVDDVLALDQTPASLAVQIKRAERLLCKRMENYGAGGELRVINEKLHRQCEHHELQRARQQEKLLALAATARRLATGEIDIAKLAPRIQIVCASKSQASSAEQLATQMGFVAQTSNSGKEALEQIAQEAPAVILCDGTLPDMDASILAHAARKTIGSKPLIVIAWSSNPEAEDGLLAPETGVDYFAPKSRGIEATNLLAAAFLAALR